MRQIGLALCLMASLLIGHASACTCTQQESTVAPEIDCHSEHGSSQGAESPGASNTVDEECICIVEQPAPVVAAKSSNKKFKSNEVSADSFRVSDNLTFVAVASVDGTPPQFTKNLSYSATLKSLLPARAPPRL